MAQARVEVSEDLARPEAEVVGLGMVLQLGISLQDETALVELVQNQSEGHAYGAAPHYAYVSLHLLNVGSRHVSQLRCLERVCSEALHCCA